MKIFSHTRRSDMEAYNEMVKLSSTFFRIIGIEMFQSKGNYWRVSFFLGYQFLSIISNAFVTVQSFHEHDMNVFSTCIVILSATALVVVKIVILLMLRKEFDESFQWIEKCFCEEYNDIQVDTMWSDNINRCRRDTLFYTRWKTLSFHFHSLNPIRFFRLLYRLYFTCITVMFVYNLSFNRSDPPLEFYALFIDRSKSFYYIGNFIYQLVLFLDLLLCAAAVESAFVMLTIFVTCRLNFILKMFQFIDDRKEGGDGVLEWINFTAKIHVDVLRLGIRVRTKWIQIWRIFFDFSDKYRKSATFSKPFYWFSWLAVWELKYFRCMFSNRISILRCYSQLLRQLVKYLCIAIWGIYWREKYESIWMVRIKFGSL